MYWSNLCVRSPTEHEESDVHMKNVETAFNEFNTCI